MKRFILSALAFCALSFGLKAEENVFRLGIIGLDTSHSTAFTELLNGDGDSPYVKQFEVVATSEFRLTSRKKKSTGW